MRAFNVYLNGKEIDTVFYGTNVRIDEAEIQRSLIEHDSYDPRIVMIEYKGAPSVSFSERAREAWAEDDEESLMEILDEIVQRFQCPDCFGEYCTPWDIPARKVICNSCNARITLA